MTRSVDLPLSPPGSLEDPDPILADPAQAGAGDRNERRGRPLLWTGVVGAAIVIIIVVTMMMSAPDLPLDPDSTYPTGTHALVTLLGERGIDVRRVPTVKDAVRVGGQRPVTAVVPDPSVVTDIAALFGLPAGSTVVVVEPNQDDTSQLLPDLGAADSAEDTLRSAACSLPAAQTAGDVTIGGTQFEHAPTSTVLCYPGQGGAALAAGRSYNLDIVLLGDGTPLTNRRLDHDGNAALAIGLLDQHQTLVWVQPRPGQSGFGASERATVPSLLPSRLRLAAWQVLIAVLVIAAWRGRRLGRPVREPLPVSVPIAEATVGRARLYRTARAYPTAAAHLRSGSLARLRVSLGLPADYSPAAMVGAVTDRVARPPSDVQALLFGGPPKDDADLVRLARALTALEREVRRS